MEMFLAFFLFALAFGCFASMASDIYLRAKDKHEERKWRNYPPI